MFFYTGYSYYFYEDTWLGLQDPNGVNDWSWSDGTAFDYTNWNGNQPDNVNEKCGYVS